MSYDLDDRLDVITADREPPAVHPDLPPHPDERREGFCPRCGDRLVLEDDVEWHRWESGGARVEWKPGARRRVWSACEQCAEDDALDRMRARTPWLFAEPGVVDEHDVMAQDWRAGIDVCELVR